MPKTIRAVSRAIPADEVRLLALSHSNRGDVYMLTVRKEVLECIGKKMQWFEINVDAEHPIPEDRAKAVQGGINNNILAKQEISIRIKYVGSNKFLGMPLSGFEAMFGRGSKKD